MSYGNRGVRHIRDGEQELALGRVQFRDASVRLFDLLRKLFHLRNQGIRVLLFFFQARNFIARFVPLRFALFIRGDLFPAIFVKLTESVQIERDIAALRHFGENIEVLAKITQVMHCE